MTDILLIILIVLASILILLMAIQVLFKKGNHSANYDKKVMADLLNEARIKMIKDTQDSIYKQNIEIQNLKEAITNGMNEAQSNNQISLFKFLDETKVKLTEIQSNFSKESSDTRQLNLKNIQELINQTQKDLNDLKSKILNEINETNLKITLM